MPFLKIVFSGLLLTSVLALESKCPADDISKLVVCYYKNEVPLIQFNVCNCTHVIFTNGVRTENNTITATEDSLKYLTKIKEKKANLSAIFTLEVKQDDAAQILKSGKNSEKLINEIFEFLRDSLFDGVELNFRFSADDGVNKESFAAFVKGLSKKLSSNHGRIKRESYDVIEKLHDDITTAAYTTQSPKNSTSKTQSIKRKNLKQKENSRKVREYNEEDERDADYLTLEETINTEFTETKLEESNTLKSTEDSFEEKKCLIFVRLSIKPEIIAKKFNLKSLSRYADYLIVPTHNILSDDEEHLTYHPSRLMGLSDILNTDSILDLLTGMGVLKSKIVISLPATVLKFQLEDENKNTPRSPSLSTPQIINQQQLCALFNKSNWTVERDDDLTAPYAFSGKTWLAFEDEISINIKGKYILLRELAGGAIYPINADLNDGPCTNHTGLGGYLTGILHKNFERLERKPRALVLESLQNEIHDTTYTNLEGEVKASEYRIVRVVDHSGAVHVIRKNTKTQFECSRQGYYSHPLGCNKFYRCVKFDQYSDEFTVFEYDCPAGLAFDERWEVCVWPGSLPNGAPCTGSSEIAPVPRSHYKCPSHEGYFADPENCRWFFACLDHAQDGITPLTAYEFRCPFGLVFNEQKLICDWPWLVGSCGNSGTGIQLTTFINGGNLETSFEQFAGSDVSFIDFGKKSGSSLNSGRFYNERGSYDNVQNAGFGYIASKFDDSRNRESFAAFPDYEISGGRIFNKEGVVLNQNVAGISASTNGYIKNNFGKINDREGVTGAFRDFDVKTEYVNQKIVPLLDETRGSSKIKFQNSETSKTNNLGISEEISPYGQIPHQEHKQNSLTILKPFSVSSSLDHKNPTFEPTEQFKGNQYSGPDGFAFNQPDVSVLIPFAVSSSTTLTPNEVKSSYLKSESQKTPLEFVDSTPKPELFNFEQINHKPGKLSNTFFANHVPVLVGGGQLLGGSSGSQTVNKLVSVSSVSSKPENQPTRFNVFNVNSDINQSLLSKGSFSSKNFKTTDQNSAKNVFVDTSPRIPAAEEKLFESTKEVKNVIVENINVESPQVSPIEVSPPIYISTPKIETKSGASLSEVSLLPATHSSIDRKISNELRLLKPQNIIAVPTLIPKNIHVVSKTISSAHTNQPTAEITVTTPKPDFKIFLQKDTHLRSLEGKSEFEVPIVTPQPNAFSYYGSTSAASFNNLEVSSVTDNVEHVKTFTKEFYDGSSTVPESNIYSIEEANSHKQKEALRGQIFLSVPGVTSETKTGSFIQGTPHSFVTPKPEIKLPQVSYPSQIAFDQQYFSSVQKSGNHFSAAQPPAAEPPAFERTNIFTLKEKQPNIFKDLSVKQEPIVSVGSISPTNIHTPTSTPELRFFSQNDFSKSLGEHKFNSETVSSQPKQITVTALAPVVSITPPTPVAFVSKQQSPDTGVHYTYKSLQPFASKQPNDINIETNIPPHRQTLFNWNGNPIFSQKSNVNSFPSVAHVTASKPLTYKKETLQRISDESSLLDRSPAYLSLDTPKTEIFGSTNRQDSQVPLAQFTTERNQIFIQNDHLKPLIKSQLDFIENKPSTEENRLQYIQKQVSAPISTALPEFQQRQQLSPIPTTSKPTEAREKLVELEISKSVELNPNQFFQISNKNLPPNLSSNPLVIQQQPLSLLSQKTVPVKQVIQPFFKQAKEETKDLYKNKFDEQNQFLQAIRVEEPKIGIIEQQQHSSPPLTSQPQLSTVSFTAAKTISFEQPSVYSVESKSVTPALPVLESSQISQSGPVDTTVFSIKNNAYVKNAETGLLFESNKKPESHNIFSTKLNLLLPTSTESPQHTLLQAEELSVKTHTNFDSQKINAFSSTPAINVFIQPEIQSTSKPVVTTFETPVFQYNGVQNPTISRSRSRFDSRAKYAFNPNIEIPEPPKEYILSQNRFTTAVPELSTASRDAGQFQSITTESIKNGFKGSTYLLPTSQNSKANVISSSNFGEVDISDDKVQQIFDKYSEKFGQARYGKNEKFTTRISNKNNNDELKINKKGPYTGQYEIKSTTSRPSSRGRQYHGGITSNLKATNKYEEYDIDRDKENQKSFNFKESSKDSDVSKTTIDLKNLRVDKNKKTVIVVSQVSDANPVLIGKLAGQCSCQSNMIELRGKNKARKSSSRRKNNSSQNQEQPKPIFNEFVPPYENDQSDFQIQGIKQGEASTAAPKVVVIDGSKSLKERVSYSSEQNLVPTSTTSQPELASSTLLSSLGPEGVLSITPKAVLTGEKNRKKQFRGRSRYFALSPPVDNGPPATLLSAVPASEIANTLDFSALKGDESRIQNEINGGTDGGVSKLLAGAAFDRYGPGGWRGFDETLQGSVDCKRPGLFRHPKYCNKFYACNYDPWKERYTLHVFNCPIHLTYDSSISACNWPVRGPQCADDNLLV